MAASKRPPKSEAQNQDTEAKKSEKETAPTGLKKTPVEKPETESPLPPDAKVPDTGAREKTEPAPQVRPGRLTLLAGIVVLSFAAGIIGGGGAAYVLLQKQGAFSVETAAPEDTRLASIQQELEGIGSDIAALQQKSDRLEGGLERLRLQEPQQSGPDAAAFVELVDRVTGLEQALALALNGGSQSAPVLDGAAMAELNTALRALGQDLNAFESQVNARFEEIERNAPPADLDQILGALAPRSSVRELGVRLTALELDRSGSDAKRAALGLSLAGLMRAADRGEPFTAELETIALLAPDRSGWKSLEPYAAQGLRPVGLLTRDFDEVARAVLQAERMQGIETWWQRLWANISGLVTVRRTGDLKGQTSEAMIARTERHLTDGNLRAAAQELQGLDGAAAASIAPWLGEVEGRLTLDDLVSSLSAGLLSELGAQDKTQ